MDNNRVNAQLERYMGLGGTSEITPMQCKDVV